MLILQFIKLNHSEVSETIVRGATAGMKEGDNSFLNVLGDLFLPLSKKRIKEAAPTDAQENRYVDRLSRSIESSDAYDKVSLGAYPMILLYGRKNAKYGCLQDVLSITLSFVNTRRISFATRKQLSG